ncbi:MAG: MFS transporter [Bacteroidota bacterium]|nr:MFS transporter [Bacteroidota bacterium]
MDIQKPKHDPYAALRVRSFRLYILTRLVNNIGFQVFDVAVAWQIYSLTKDPLSLGLVGLCVAVPAISISLYGGHISDRKNRRTIAICMLYLLTLNAVVLIVISLNVHEIYAAYGTLPFYIILFLGGLESGLLAPSIIAFSYLLIPQEHAPNASAWRSSSWQLAAIAGPALGGLLYGFLGATGTYAASASLTFTGTLLIWFIPPQPVASSEGEETIYDSLKKGIHFVFKNQVIVGALSLDLFAVLFGGAVAMLPVYASDILVIGPQGLGILRASPAIGAVIVAFWMAHRPLKGAVGKKLFIAVIGFGLTIIVFGISKSVPLSVCMLALGGGFDSISVIVRSTLLQLSTPNEMRGRVEAVNMMFIGSSNEIGAFESGVAARLLGVIPSVVFGGCMTLVSVGVTSKVAPVLRKLRYEELLSRAQISKETK